MLEEILKETLKSKEKTAKLAECLKSDPKAMDELLELWKTAKDPVKGTLLSAITLIVSENPGFIGYHLDFVIAQICHKAPRVKWESAEIVGHASKVFPVKVIAAIPALIENTGSDGTVVRWSAAFALSEILVNIPSSREELMPKINAILGHETQHGIQIVYQRAIKKVTKTAPS